MSDLPKIESGILAAVTAADLNKMQDEAAAIHEERTISRGLAEALLLAIGEEPTDALIEQAVAEARKSAREAIAKLKAGG